MKVVDFISVHEGLDIEDNKDIQLVSTLLQAQEDFLTLKVH